MKKSRICLLSAVFAAGVALADDGSPWWKFGFGDEDADAPQEQMQKPQPPQQGGPRFEGRRPDMHGMRRSQGAGLTEEQRAKAKAYYEAVHKLAEAARNETDPVKKEALVEQLRVKLTEGAERMQQEFRKRLEKAEKEVARMRERLNEGEKNMSERVEEHLRKILSGERPERPRRGGPDHPFERPAKPGSAEQS